MLATMQGMLQQMQMGQQELLKRVEAAEARAKAAEEKKGTASQSSMQIIDGRLLDKIQNFDGKKSSWQDWSFSFKSILEPSTLQALTWAVEIEDVIDVEAINVEREEWCSHSQALYRALALKANKGEAATRIRQAGAGNGLEAWKLLMQYYEPKSRGRQREVFLRISRPKVDKNRSLLNNIESWEQDVRDYEKRFEKKVDQDLRVSVLLEMAPESIKEHIYINSEKFSTYESIRDKLATYIESKSKEEQDSCPMDLDALEANRSQKFDGYCYGCG